MSYALLPSSLSLSDQLNVLGIFNSFEAHSSMLGPAQGCVGFMTRTDTPWSTHPPVGHSLYATNASFFWLQPWSDAARSLYISLACRLNSFLSGRAVSFEFVACFCQGHGSLLLLDVLRHVSSSGHVTRQCLQQTCLPSWLVNDLLPLGLAANCVC